MSNRTLAKMEVQEVSAEPKRTWKQLLADDFLIIVPATMVLSALLLTTLHSGWVSSRFIYSVLVTAFAVVPIAFVFYGCTALNAFREHFDR